MSAYQNNQEGHTPTPTGTAILSTGSWAQEYRVTCYHFHSADWLYDRIVRRKSSGYTLILRAEGNFTENLPGGR